MGERNSSDIGEEQNIRELFDKFISSNRCFPKLSPEQAANFLARIQDHFYDVFNVPWHYIPVDVAKVILQYVLFQDMYAAKKLSLVSKQWRNICIDSRELSEKYHFKRLCLDSEDFRVKVGLVCLTKWFHTGFVHAFDIHLYTRVFFYTNQEITFSMNLKKAISISNQRHAYKFTWETEISDDDGSLDESIREITGKTDVANVPSVWNKLFDSDYLTVSKIVLDLWEKYADEEDIHVNVEKPTLESGSGPNKLWIELTRDFSESDRGTYIAPSKIASVINDEDSIYECYQFLCDDNHVLKLWK